VALLVVAATPPRRPRFWAAAQMCAARSGRQAYDRTKPLPRRFRGVVAYDGTDYVGWQTQPSGGGVQDVIETRLSQLFGGRVFVAGSGRTDKGVHARGQVFHFEPPVELEPGAKVAPHIAKAMNGSDDELAAVLGRTLGSLSSGLPRDVQVRDITPAPEGFHARENCIGKRYVYTVHEGAGDPMTARYRWTLGTKHRLDVPRMIEAAARLVGTHDFSTFGVRAPSDPRSPVKRLRRLEVRRLWCADPVREASRRLGPSAAALEADVATATRTEGSTTGGCLGDERSFGGTQVDEDAGAVDGVESVVTICAECDRYLYNMMRLISGTLVQVGLGRLTPNDVTELLEARGRKVVRLERGLEVFKAPAHGLTLEHCFYSIPSEEWMPVTGLIVQEQEHDQAAESVPPSELIGAHENFSAHEATTGKEDDVVAEVR